MQATKFLALSALLLLGGCLEAKDSIAGSIRARVNYCHVPPDAVVLCRDKPAGKPLVLRSGQAAPASGPVTK
jgi:hypothetical protein